MKGNRRILSRLALLCFGIVLSLGMVEGLSRLIYTKPWYDKLLEEQVDTDWTAHIQRNAYGLRGHDYAPVKAPQTRRVLLLGDSFTFGSGVADDGAVFPALLEQQLNAEFASRGIEVDVLNGGIPGSLTDDWVDLLQKVRGSYQPDLVVIVFFMRDGTRTNAADSFFIPVRDQVAKQNQQSWLYQDSFLYRLYKDAKDGAFISDSYSKAIRDAYSGVGAQTDEWRVAQFNIRKIKAIDEETNTRTALVVFPILAQLDARYPFKDVGDLIAAYGSENDLPVHNLLPAFLGHNAADLWVSPNNQHPNALGHQIAANSLLPFLRRLLQE